MDYDWIHYEWAASVEKTRDMQPRDFEDYKDAATVIIHQRDRIEALERENEALRRGIARIRELNMVGPDEEGNTWANSDLIEQEIVFFMVTA